MDIYEPLPVLIKAEINDDLIEFRLDKFGLGNFETRGNSVLEIKLSGCKSVPQLKEDIEELINEVFEYEVFTDVNKTIFQFWGDYGRIEYEIECENFEEAYSEYTNADLVQKGTALYKLYVNLHDRLTRNSAANSQLRDKLRFEIGNQIERSQRKSQFFEERDKGKSEAFQSAIRFLEKIQNFITGKSES
jgi:hypothetical protein